MLRQADHCSTSGGPEPPAIQPSTRTLMPIVSQPTSKPIELPPQYRPRKPRKQVNVACQACRKRRSKCTGTQPCTRCTQEGNECVFDGRKDAQERNRELRNSEKALSKVFRVLKKLEGGDATSAAAFSQIRRLAQDTTDISAFARELFDLDEKNNLVDFADYDTSNGSNRVLAKREDGARPSLSWLNRSPTHSVEDGLTPRSSNGSRHNSRAGEFALPDSRQSPASIHAFGERTNAGSISDFGNLPFSSAIKANGYPAHIQHQQLQNLSTASEYSMLPLHTFEQEALGRAYLSFRDATLQMIADGMSAREVLGPPDYVNLDLYFRERLPEDGHSVSTFVCEIMKNLANPDMYAKLASMVLLAPLMRWILFPTSEHYSRIPTLMRPLPSQRFIPHSPALDLAPHPAIRGVLMSSFNEQWLTPENQITAAPVVNWHKDLDETVYHDPVAGCIRFTKEFEDHVTDAKNWTFSERVLEVFPSIQEHGAIIVEGQERPQWCLREEGTNERKRKR